MGRPGARAGRREKGQRRLRFRIFFFFARPCLFRWRIEGASHRKPPSFRHRLGHLPGPSLARGVGLKRAGRVLGDALSLPPSKRAPPLPFSQDAFAARLPRVPALAIPEGAAGAGAAGHATRCAQGVFVKRSDDRRRGPMRQRGPRSFASPSHAAHAHHTSPLLLGRAPAAGVGPGPVPAAVHAGRGRGKKGVGEEERRPLSDSEWRGPPAPDARCRPRIQDRGEI